MLNVSWTSLLPSAFIFQMFPPRENAIFAPFGDQSGRSSTLGPVVRRVGSEPSASITQMSSRAARSLVNAIFVPSGDHSGNASNPFVSVSRVWFVPFASITQMSCDGSAASDVYAICVPSGDHVGQVSCTSGVNVIRSSSLPSAFIDQMSQLGKSPSPHRE